MVTTITLKEVKEDKSFIIDVNKNAITSVEYLNELDARITNLEKIFNITVTRKVKKQSQ